MDKVTAYGLIADIYNSADVKDVIANVADQRYAKDILQSCFLAMLEMPKRKTVALHRRGKLKSYIIKSLCYYTWYKKTKLSRQLGLREVLTLDIPDSIDYISFEYEELIIENKNVIDRLSSKEKIEKAQELLAEVYQEIGQIKY